MKKLSRIGLLLLIFTVGALQACGGDDDNDTGGTGTGGTDIENTGGNGNTKLSPDAEKAFLEQTSNQFLSYFDATEFDQMADAYRQAGDKSDDGFDDWMDDIMSNVTKTGSYSGYWYSEEYYDALIRATNVRGSFSTSYNSDEWVRTSTTGNLTLTYTDRNNATWVLTVVPSGSVKGTIKDAFEFDREEDDTYKYYNLSVEVPERITARLTRQGVTQATADINISGLEVNEDEPAMSHANATVAATLLSFSANTTFSYAPNSGSTVTGTLKKGNVTLLSFNVAGTPRVLRGDLRSGRNLTAMVDILGLVQVHATCTDTETLSDAFAGADDNYDDGDAVNRYAARANSAFTGYITNKGGSAHQADIRFARKSERDYGEYYYSLEPALYFSDDTSYSFEEYFSERYFENVIDAFNRILDDFEHLAD